jgi:hypothetical protein
MKNLKITISVKLINELECNVTKYAEYFTQKNNDDYIFVTKDERKLGKDKGKKFEKLHEKFGDKKHNLYAFYFFESGDWVLKYIGQSKGEYFYQRMKQHFFQPHPKTNSIYNKIMNEKKIAVKSICVNPEELRQYYEQRLIQLLDPCLNNHSRK